MVLLAGGALPASAEQANLRRFAEYHISSQNLLTFSREGASVKLCVTCSPTYLTSNGNTRWYLFNHDISLQQATAHYVSKEYAVIFVGTDRQNNTLEYVRFGGHPSDASSPLSSPDDLAEVTQ